MKTKLEKLQIAINSNRGLVKESLVELLSLNPYLQKKPIRLRTGKSGYSKGWASKSIWTSDVLQVLQGSAIKCVAGNDAPRGGASGEFIEIVDKVLIKQLVAKKESERIEIERIKEENRIKKEELRVKVIEKIKTLSLDEQFEAKWNSSELKEASGLSWSAYRSELKQLHPFQWSILKEKFILQNSIK